MLDRTRKLKINEIEYNFKMVNKTIFKIDEKYGNYGSVLEGIMKGKAFYTNALKLLSCSCVEKDFEIDELIELLTPQQLQEEIPPFVTNLYFDYMGINNTDKIDNSKKEKN